MVSDGPDFLSHRDLILSTRRPARRSEYLRRLDGLLRILLSRWPTRRLGRPPNPRPESGPSIINLFLIRQRTGSWFKSHPVHFALGPYRPIPCYRNPQVRACARLLRCRNYHSAQPRTEENPRSAEAAPP